MTRKIAVFTGNRAEYGLLGPVLDAIASRSDLELQLIVGGAHFDAEYGGTAEEILADGFEVAAKTAVDPSLDTARAIGHGTIAVVDALEALRPDAFVVYGDRFEAFAALIAATQSNIPSVHIEGGDKTEGGALDDSVRHAMTKLAHIHLATNIDAARRIEAMGEELWRIHDVGLPVLDRVRAGQFPGADEVSQRLSLELDRPVIVFTQHAIATEPNAALKQLEPSLKALEHVIEDSGAQIVATFPNNDDGGRAIISRLKEWEAGRSNVVLRQSLGRALYHGVLNLAGHVTRGVCVGNSSSGLKETPAFGCPAVNIGARQSGRLAAENVMHVGNNADEIASAITHCISSDAFRETAKTCTNPYGDGRTGPRVAKILAELKLDDVSLIQKKLTLDP